MDRWREIEKEILMLQYLLVICFIQVLFPDSYFSSGNQKCKEDKSNKFKVPKNINKLFNIKLSKTLKLKF